MLDRLTGMQQVLLLVAFLCLCVYALLGTFLQDASEKVANHLNVWRSVCAGSATLLVAVTIVFMLFRGAASGTRVVRDAERATYTAMDRLSRSAAAVEKAATKAIARA
jgi:hypothetical protein